MSLKRKFLKQIFPPLTLSIFLTAIISTALIVYYNYSTFRETEDAVMDSELSFMKMFSSSLSTLFELNLQAMIRNIFMILNHAESIYQKQATSNDTFENKFILNSLDIAENKFNLSELKGYDSKVDANYEYSMWYIPNKTQDLTTKEINQAFNFFSEMDLVIRSVNLANSNNHLTYGFLEGNGFQFKYPSYSSSIYINFTSNDSCEYTVSGTTEFYDMRCRPYAKNLKKHLKNPNITIPIIISDPYFYIERNQIGVTICGYNVKNATVQNFSLLDPEKRELNYVFCIDLDLFNPQNLFEIKDLSYFLLDKEKVFFHPDYIKSGKKNNYNSITELEFHISDLEKNKEALLFNKTFLMPVQEYYNNRSNFSSVYEYKKNGKDYLATVSPIEVSKIGENNNSTGLLCVIIEPKKVIFEVFFILPLK